ncbi:MAG: ribonuclease HII [Candidatus Saccharibacteria bacterium]|nr:ribonuclease HII [Candidatus Saccharibacteria bacterium]
MIGIDEVGRGAWAGPLVVAGCCFHENPGFTRGLDDSKKLTRKKREELDGVIKSNTFFKIVSLSHKRVDRLGLTEATKQAILEIIKEMPSNADIILDGKYNFLKGTKYETRTKVVIGADGKYPSVMAASIIAKVERDSIMQEFDKKYPEYGFDKNVGYGTKKHAQALRKHGITPIHRLSFNPIKELL